MNWTPGGGVMVLVVPLSSFIRDVSGLRGVDVLAWSAANCFWPALLQLLLLVEANMAGWGGWTHRVCSCRVHLGEPSRLARE